MGGAGIHADIKTISALGAHAATAITSVTAQNSKGVKSIHVIPPTFIKEQLNCVLEEVIPDAVKIGMLGNGSAIAAVAEILAQRRTGPVVLDPVLRASAGGELLEKGALETLVSKLMPLCNVVCPNIPEAEVLAEIEIRTQKDMMEAAKRIAKLGPSVVITGGHLGKMTTDLVFDTGKFLWVKGHKLHTPNTHGTGCVFSSALATYLAKGKSVMEAIKMAHDFTRYAIIYSYPLGNGYGPVRPIRPGKFRHPKEK